MLYFPNVIYLLPVRIIFKELGWLIRPSRTEVEIFFASHTIFWLILLPKARESSIGPIWKKTLSVDPAISNFEIVNGTSKIQNVQIWILQMGARKLRNDERIPNLVSEFKSDNIWPPFWQKTVKHWPNSPFR